MLNYLKIIVLTFVSVSIIACGSDDDGDSHDNSSFTKTSFPVTVEAQIDGRSRLVIKENLIWWHHQDWEPPGLWDDDEPTRLNGERWFPEWPSGNLTDCDCESSTLDALESPLRSDPTMISITVTTARGTVIIAEQPNVNNDFTASIEFNDNNKAGADWYEIIINYN